MNTRLSERAFLKNIGGEQLEKTPNITSGLRMHVCTCSYLTCVFVYDYTLHVWCVYMFIPSYPHEHTRKANASRMQFTSYLGDMFLLNLGIIKKLHLLLNF